MTDRPPTPLKSIRAYCLDCCLGSYTETKRCTCESCACWPYRLGRNPKQARTGLAATYTVAADMTARKAIHLRCQNCQQKTRGNCGVRDCHLYHVRYAKTTPSRSGEASPLSRSRAGRATAPPTGGAA